MGHEIEVILARQLASSLAIPVFLVDARGNLIFYNEPAESILGKRFDETGEMSAPVWATQFRPHDDQNRLLDASDLPLVIALRDLVPATGTFRIAGMDGINRRIEVTAFPLLRQAQELVGAMALFWERP